jgi:hypothetical protein
MPKEHDPQLIQQKIKAGLTRDQAIQVLDRQTQPRERQSPDWPPTQQAKPANQTPTDKPTKKSKHP